MKKFIISLLCIVAAFAVVLTCTAASAKPETFTIIIEHIESFVDEMTTQIFGDYDKKDELYIDKETESITEPKDENAQGICSKIVYGYSEMGQPLEAFIINGSGANNKVFFMDFAIHGFEDEYANDGKVLVDLGYSLIEYYSKHPESLGDYQMVIVPCANPDGVMYGVNDYRAGDENAFGRCTYSGIDINRDFKAGLFKAVESRALKNLMDEYKPSIYINFHGWENSVLGDPELIRILVPSLALSRGNPDWYRVEDGFIMGYVKDHYGARSALVEFENSSSVNAFQVIYAIDRVISEV
ncbi:MAG: hypothetical protein J1E05_07975 [Eubacterium sp.]|nr:hypothetical protein [Eubacterium sp.]